MLPSKAKLPNKTKKPALALANVLITARWTVHEIHIYSIQQKKWTNRKKYMRNSFFFNYNSRIIPEYFQAKIGRNWIRIFRLARKNNILRYIYKKGCIQICVDGAFVYNLPKITCVNDYNLLRLAIFNFLCLHVLWLLTCYFFFFTFPCLHVL